MTLGALLAIIFVVLQLTGQIHWAWWQICLPIFIEIGFYPLLLIGFLAVTVWAAKD